MAFNITPQSILSNVNFGINLLTGSLAYDTVGIFNQQSFQQVFSDARPVKASVRETSRVMDHPVETGVVLSDHHVINPSDIFVTMVINSRFYASTYQQIKAAYVNATLLSVQTRPTVFPNMIIAAMPHEEDPDMFDIITINLHLREVLYVTPSSIAPATQPANYSPNDPKNFTTIKRGQQSAGQSQTVVVDGRPMSVIAR